MAVKVQREKPLSENEFDIKAAKIAMSFSNDKDNRLFKVISQKGWFKSYGLKSQSQFRKISAKVKRGIKAGKFNYENEKTPAHPDVGGNEKRRKITPKEKGEKKIRETNLRTKANQSKSETNKKKYLSAGKKYLDASNYEIVHGVNSKASQNYRVRHGKSREYAGRINLKGTGKIIPAKKGGKKK